MTEKEDRRVGFWGRDNIAVEAALGGILHLEAAPDTNTALCNGHQLDYRAYPSHILGDRGYVISRLRICTRCEKKARDIEFSVVDEPQSGDDSTLIDWSELGRLAPTEREAYLRKALEQIDDVVATAPRGARMAKVEMILMHLGTDENLKI